MPTVLITPEALVNVESTHTKLLRDAGFDVTFPANPQFTRGVGGELESMEVLRDCDAVIAGSEYLTSKVIRSLPRLRVIARNGVGYDRVDVAEATSQNVVLTITPQSFHEAAAEHALALLFAVSKNIVVGDRATRSGQWPRKGIEPIRGKTIGILGLGRIGRSMATRSAALGMTVIAHDVDPNVSFARQHNIELVDFETIIARCDVLSIHCPMTEQTRGMINASVFERMKPTAIVINTARGGVIHEADLIDALQTESIRAAGLDVFAQEPPARDNPLFQLDNVVLSPHAAGADSLAMQNMAIESAGNVVALFRGEWPDEAVINKELKGRWKW